MLDGIFQALLTESQACTGFHLGTKELAGVGMSYLLMPLGIRGPVNLTVSLAEWLRRLPWERKILGLNPAFAEIFPGSSHTSDLKIGSPVATLPGAWLYRVSVGTGWPGVRYCDWVRWKVWSATSISEWQHVKLSEQIRPLACCWDVQQPTSQPTSQSGWPL